MSTHAPSSMGDINEQIARLRRCELLTESEVKALCGKVRELLADEPNVITLATPITVAGDIHGQFYDLLELFEVAGAPPGTAYLFMGDFVDRGYYSVESLLLLLAYKVRYPDRIALIRGNHESRQITQVYGFYDECLRKFGSVNVWRMCCDVFDHLALVASIDNGNVLAVHGGLSPSLTTLDGLKEIDRVCEPPHDGAMSDLLWSDPDESVDGWSLSPRGAGYLFGRDVALSFCATNDIQLIARAHQLVMEGHRSMFEQKVVTVWSAPNYCYRCGNVAAVMELDEAGGRRFRVFEAAPCQGDKSAPGQKRPVSEYFL